MDNKLDDFNIYAKRFKESLRNDKGQKNKEYNLCDMNRQVNDNRLLKKVDSNEMVLKRKEIQTRKNDLNLNKYKQHLNKKEETILKQEPNLIKPKNLSHLQQTKSEEPVLNHSYTQSKLIKLKNIQGTNPASFLSEKELQTVNFTPYSEQKKSAVANIYCSNKYTNTLVDKKNNEKEMFKKTNKVTSAPKELLLNFSEDIKKYAVKHYLKTPKTEESNTKIRIFGYCS